MKKPRKVRLSEAIWAGKYEAAEMYGNWLGLEEHQSNPRNWVKSTTQRSRRLSVQVTFHFILSSMRYQASYFSLKDLVSLTDGALSIIYAIGIKCAHSYFIS